MAVPKKRTSASKKRIRKNVWKAEASWAALKAFSLAKSLSTGKSFFIQQRNCFLPGIQKGFFYNKQIEQVRKPNRLEKLNK